MIIDKFLSEKKHGGYLNPNSACEYIPFFTKFYLERMTRHKENTIYWNSFKIKYIPRNFAYSMSTRL